jgi:DNA repair exonuclease SbcCD nuclease subunit
VKPPESQRRILLAHLLLRELNMPSAHASLAELSADKYNYVALGDYHLKYETVYGGTPAIYPGSTEALNVLEASSDKYVALVDLSGREAIVNWVKLNTPRKWIVIEARNYIDLLTSIGKAKLERLLKPPILHLIFKSKPSDVEVKRIREYLSKLSEEKKVLLWRVEVEEEAGGSVSRSLIAESPSTSQAPTLDQVVYSVLGDRDVAELILAILRSSESKEEVKVIVERVLGDEKLIAKIKRLVSEK